MATRTRTVPRQRAQHLGPERRRPQVLDAALGLFLEHGYEKASMQAVADRAGVTKPVVYACFDGKEELFNALLAREEERILGELEGAFEASDLEDVRGTLVDGFTGLFTAVAASPDVYRLIFLGEAGGNAAVARRVQRGRKLQVEAISVLTRRWLGGSGEKAETEARLLAYSVVGLAEAGARLLLSGTDGWTPEALGREMGRLAASAAAWLV